MDYSIVDLETLQALYENVSIIWTRYLNVHAAKIYLNYIKIGWYIFFPIFVNQKVYDPKIMKGNLGVYDYILMHMYGLV